MSWDRCQAESLIFIYQYIQIFWFVNWSWIKLRVVRHDSTLNQSTSQLSMSYSFVPCSCWCVLNFHWVAASVKRFTIKFTIQIPPSLNLVVTISRLKIAACGLKQAFNLSIILASHKVISCKCRMQGIIVLSCWPTLLFGVLSDISWWSFSFNLFTSRSFFFNSCLNCASLSLMILCNLLTWRL